MSDDQVVEVTITAPRTSWLAEFVATLVADRLCAACHLDEIRSLYRWRSMQHDEREMRAVLHTRAGLVLKIIDRTNREHPYEVPCVIANPIAGGSSDYLDWVLAETDSGDL